MTMTEQLKWKFGLLNVQIVGMIKLYTRCEG